jgi:flagellar basal-body rod modification protein FlgD
MTTVTSTGTTASSGSSSGTTKSGWASLGATDFLKMLTAQLQNQDPTSPMDNTQMVAQLAQFSALSNSSETNTTLGTIADKLDKLNSASASNSDIAATLKTISQQLAAISAAGRRQHHHREYHCRHHGGLIPPSPTDRTAHHVVLHFAQRHQECADRSQRGQQQHRQLGNQRLQEKHRELCRRGRRHGLHQPAPDRGDRREGRGDHPELQAGRARFHRLLARSGDQRRWVLHRGFAHHRADDVHPQRRVPDGSGGYITDAQGNRVQMYPTDATGTPTSTHSRIRWCRSPTPPVRNSPA